MDGGANMRRTRLLVAGLTASTLAVGLGVCLGQGTPPAKPGMPGDYGPGVQGAVLKQPFGSAPVGGAPIGGGPSGTGQAPPGSYVQGVFGQTPPGDPTLGGANPEATIGGSGVGGSGGVMYQGGQFKPPPYQPRPDPNYDIKVTPELGPWMIYVYSYEGPEAPIMARQMVAELRGQYKLPAYVFNRGEEERRKEYERVCDVLRKQHDFFRQNNLPVGSPFRVKHMRVEEQCAVLVGGYRDDDAANRALKSIRRLDKPDPKRVKLDTKVVAELDPKTGEAIKGAMDYVNPFTRAIVVRNPTVKFDRPKEWDEQDIAMLKRLNQDETFSLLKCKKPYTLLVKAFPLPNSVTSRTAKGSFLENLGLGKKTSEDTAAAYAHVLADAFRRKQIDAYVLHMRSSSLVTVGAFDSPDDPNLRTMQQVLSTHLNVPQSAPMQVPRVH